MLLVLFWRQPLEQFGLIKKRWMEQIVSEDYWEYLDLLSWQSISILILFGTSNPAILDKNDD